MSDQRATYEVQPYDQVAIPDGGRWVLVYHDGDEESFVSREIDTEGQAWIRLRGTSGDWQICSTATRPTGIPKAVRA